MRRMSPYLAGRSKGEPVRDGRLKRLQTSYVPYHWLGLLASLASVGGFACTEPGARTLSASDAGSGGAGPALGHPDAADLDAGGSPQMTGRDAGFFDGGTPDVEAGALPALPLCSRDGSTRIRLAVRVAGGGPAPPGTAMLAENGWRFLLVDASCHAWLLPGDNDELLQITLSATQEEGLARALKLGAWNGIVVPAGGCSDAPAVSFRLDQQTLTGSACGAPAGSTWSDLNASFSAQLASLGAVAAPVAGNVRYLLIADDGSLSNIDGRKPVLWPLAIPAATVAIEKQAAFQYRAGSSQSATANDAAALRTIRTTSKNGAVPGGGGGVFDYTPVVDAQGRRYQVFIRDEVPFAGPDGLFPRDL